MISARCTGDNSDSAGLADLNSDESVLRESAASALNKTTLRVSVCTAGFTLIELMVVIAMIAVASAVVSVAMRDPSATQLEREAARLIALLESARAEARSSGLSVRWESRAEQQDTSGFRFVGLPASSEMPQKWLDPAMSAEVVGASAVTLGPDPLIGAQRIVLHLADQQRVLQTDGIGPFAVVDESVSTEGSDARVQNP
jgi:general secretion pathway protein H